MFFARLSPVTKKPYETVRVGARGRTNGSVGDGGANELAVAIRYGGRRFIARGLEGCVSGYGHGYGYGYGRGGDRSRKAAAAIQSHSARAVRDGDDDDGRTDLHCEYEQAGNISGCVLLFL